MKTLFATLLLVAAFIAAKAQQFYTDLYGFRLGQYRDVVKRELGTPFKQGKYDDGFQYEVYLVKPDKSMYMVVEYAAADTSTIWSLQITGTNNTTDIGFEGLRLGVNIQETQKVLGKASSSKNIGEYGRQLDFANTNLSIEVNKEGKFSNIKITDISQDLFPKGPDVSKLPHLDEVKRVLTSNDNARILSLLAGDMELYYKGETYYLKKSIATEQATDYSKVLSIIKTVSQDLNTVDAKNADEYEENMRVALHQDIKHVMKFKKGHAIKEIVFKYFGGKYYIFEINADK